MLKKRVPREKDGFPGQKGAFYIDWMKISDLRQIIRLETAFFPEPLTLLKLIRYWLMPITYYIVIRDGRKVVAYIGFQMFGQAAHTISMGSHPDYRRQGLAALVQRTADRAAKNRGASWFTGEVRVSNVPQLLFLRELGWIEVGTSPGFFSNGEDAIVVWNWL
jgi:ribosomal-protein-alanine N-acetyltransferase